MPSADSRDRLVLLTVGLLVLLGPALILVLTLEALVLLGHLSLGRVTPIEFLELFLLELVLFGLFAYGIYRLTVWLVQHRVPAAVEAIEARSEDTGGDQAPRTDTGDSSNR